MTNAIIVVSGGLDSVATTYYIKNKLNYKKILLLFFNYNQRTLKQEEFCVKELSKNLNLPLKTIDLSWLGEISTALLNTNKEIKETKDQDLGNIEKEKQDIINYWVPCRNSLFLLAALAHAESEYLSKKERYDIFIGIKHEGKVPMKDTTPEFLKAMNNLAEQATNDGGYKIIAPFIKKDKPEIIKIGQELKVPWELTYSCYVGKSFKDNLPVHCGICSNCKQRKKAFYWANVEDPSLYF